MRKTSLAFAIKPQKTIRSYTFKISYSIALESLKIIIESKVYTLKEFIVHLNESLEKGHYVTYCFCSQEEQWFEFNNDKVKSQTVPEIGV